MAAVEHNPKAKLLSGCFVSCFLKYSCRIPQLSGCIVACNMLRPLGACCSLAIVVWPRCCRSLLGLWRGVCLLFVPFSLLNGIPFKSNTGFLHNKIYVAVTLYTRNSPSPSPSRPYYAAHIRVASDAVLKPLVQSSPPSQVKGIEEQLGRLLFWHSLYVLLIGANWHRGAPLFRCIIWPASVRRKEKAQTKGRGKIGQGLNQSTAISLLHQNSQANFVLGFVVAAYRVCWLKSAILKIWL